MKIRSIIHIMALGFLLSTLSCSNESMINGGGENPLPQVPEGMARLELITNSDDYQEPATRAVGDKLNRTPWILVFKDTGTPANDVFVEARQAIIFDGISYVMLTKTTEPIVNERKRRLLVIANSEKFRTTAAPSTEISMSEANLEAQLLNKTFSQTTQFLLTSAPLATRQITVPYTPDEPIPMSVEYKLPNGITKDTKIGGGESGDTPLKLRRAVAKVTVAVSNDPAANFGDFVLHGATVVDAPRDGYLCPPATLKNNTGNLTDYLTSATGDGVTGIAPAENVAGNITTAAHPIYVFESEAGATSVIIKGTYKGTTGYYRLAFVDNDNANAPMSVLRNTHYKFNIVKVTGTGYPSVAEAKKNPPAHDILAKIEVSDDKSHDIISNGRYYLGCSNSEFLVYADGAKSNLTALTITTNATTADILADGTNSITATTTGGTAMTVSPAKITLNTSGAAKGTETNVTVTLPVGFTAGTITLKLGNLVKTITVRREPTLSYTAISKEFATNYVSGKVTAGGAWLSLGVVDDPDLGSQQATRPDQRGNVYLFAKNNISTSGATKRTGGEVYLSRQNEQGRVKIYAEQNMLNTNTIQPSQNPLVNTYVGTFHRWNQTGERLIRIKADANNYGAWTATVISGDFIKLDLGDSETRFTTDPGVNFDANATPKDMNIPANDAAHQVKGNAITVSGNVSASNLIIKFRVGMKSVHPEGKDHTMPRYGVIMLLYNDNKYVRLIYVRQGEVPAQMKSGVPAKWSPYNLTENGGYNKNVPVNGAKFMNYPTQAGAFFQWNSLWAWTPYGSPGSWASKIHINTMWYTDLDPCPSAVYSGDERNYKSPLGGNSSWDDFRSLSTSPSIWGYYADGFFDRRRITEQPSTGSVMNSAVSINNGNVAYMGQLFYNEATKASLFVPWSGYRYYKDGKLNDTGMSGYYWSSFQNSHSYGWQLGVTRNDISQTYSDRIFGFAVRCIQN